jgi:DNA polymerase III epsilon subunit-like protein
VIEYTLQVWDLQTGRAPPQTIRLWPTMPGPGGVVPVLRPVAPEVCKINGYDPATWGTGPYAATRAFDWHDCTNLALLDGALVGGHNTNFDLDFIRGEFLRAGVKPPRWNYRLIDTQKIAGPLVAMGLIKGQGLGDLCDLFGLSREGAHTSAGDVRMTIDVWEKFCDLYLKAWGL